MGWVVLDLYLIGKKYLWNLLHSTADPEFNHVSLKV